MQQFHGGQLVPSAQSTVTCVADPQRTLGTQQGRQRRRKGGEKEKKE